MAAEIKLHRGDVDLFAKNYALERLMTAYVAVAQGKMEDAYLAWNQAGQAMDDLMESASKREEWTPEEIMRREG